MTSESGVKPSHGVHSEVGTLRKVLVCAPGLAHRRLTPSNSDDLLFDDVMWVENAQRDHADFVAELRERGVEGVERHDETLLMKAIYQFHPDFVGAAVWWGDPERDWGMATFEGGDVMPVGNGVVLTGMSERTSRQAITQVAASLFAHGAAERVVVAGMPKLRAAMHLDTVFTFADRDVVTLYPRIVDSIHTFSLRPGDTGSGVEVTDEGSR